MFCLCCVLHLCIIYVVMFCVFLFMVYAHIVHWLDHEAQIIGINSEVHNQVETCIVMVFFFSSRNTLNAKCLCLMCNSMPLPFDGDNSLNLLRLIHPKSHVLTTNVISPYHLLSCFLVMGILTLLFLWNYFWCNFFLFAFWCNPFVFSLCPT